MNEPKNQWTHIVPEVTRDYYCFVIETLHSLPAGMYGLEQRRSELHEALCRHYGLTHEETTLVTSKMEELEHGANSLHLKLQDIANKKAMNR